MKIESDFKEALAQLPEKEKDKLLVRLLRKDKVLMQKLYFELVSANTVEDERQAVATRIEEVLRNTIYTTPFGNWMWEIRSLSGSISLHLKVTKDKLGEVSLSLLLVKEILRGNTQKIHTLSPKNAHKLGQYVVSKVFKTLTLIAALHEDYWVEFRQDLEEVAELIAASEYLMRMVLYARLDVSWLADGEFPEDIKERYAASRKAKLL